MSTLIPAKDVRRALSAYAVPDTRKGLTLFVVDLVLYGAAIAAVLFAPWLALKVAASIFAGVKISNLVTLAHDAAHNSLTTSRPLNKAIAIVAFTPGLFNYRLWVYDHHVLHHSRTNETHPDSYTPLSKDQYDALSGWDKLRQRLYRAQTVWMFGVYYIVERWWRVKFFPRAHMPDYVRFESRRHFLYLLVYLAGYLGLLAAAPLYSSTGSLEALLLGFVVPFYVFQSLFSFALYLQHTHPKVAWFAEKPDRNGDGRQDLISVHMAFPEPVAYLTHYGLEHGAHHVHPAIPCYRLKEAQAHLNQLLGVEAALSERFSLGLLRDIQRRCKLYDYEQHRWLDWEGRPTSEVTRVSWRAALKA